MDAITQSGIGCRVGIRACNVIAYADDIVIMSPSLMGLQRLLNICNDFASNLKLKFNPSKSVCMKFQKTIQNCFDYTVKIGGENIEFVEEVKYLGFLMNSQLSNKFDILRERNRFYNTFNTILRKFYFVNTNIFLFLFKTYCLQFCGASLWCGVSGSKTVLKQFSVGFHKAIKKILKVPWRASTKLIMLCAKWLIL